MTDDLYEIESKIMPRSVWGKILVSAQKILRESDIEEMDEKRISSYVAAIDIAIDSMTHDIAEGIQKASKESD